MTPLALLAAAANVAAAPCALPPGWEAVDERRPRFVVIGETHGTVEVPALVGSIACALARRGERVLVAVEEQAVGDDALQAAWRMPDERFADALRSVPGWRGRDDGVASLAMFRLLLTLHRLRPAVDVAAFNGERDEAQRRRFASLPGQGPHEAEQADNIRRAVARGRYTRVLVLAGSFHAGKRPVGAGSDRFDPMARRLAPAEQVVSLRAVDGGGSFWACALPPGVRFAPGRPVPAGAVTCGPHPSRPTAALGPAPLIRVGDPPGAEAGEYDGFVWTGPVSASPPAIPQGE